MPTHLCSAVTRIGQLPCATARGAGFSTFATSAHSPTPHKCAPVASGGTGHRRPTVHPRLHTSPPCNRLLPRRRVAPNGGHACSLWYIDIAALTPVQACVCGFCDDWCIIHRDCSSAIGGILKSAPYSPPSLTPLMHRVPLHIRPGGTRQLPPAGQGSLPPCLGTNHHSPPRTSVEGGPLHPPRHSVHHVHPRRDRARFQGGVRAPQFPSLGNAQLPLS